MKRDHNVSKNQIKNVDHPGKILLVHPEFLKRVLEAIKKSDLNEF